LKTTANRNVPSQLNAMDISLNKKENIEVMVLIAIITESIQLREQSLGILIAEKRIAILKLS
jgi:hypothetical protein